MAIQHRETCRLNVPEGRPCTCDYPARYAAWLGADEQSQHAADRERAYECDHGGRS